MNTLVWKLLRKHISIGQLAGFFFANLVGVFIVMLSVQMYRDALPFFQGGDSVVGKQYIIVSKRVSTLGSLMGDDGSCFSDNEIKRIEEQPFCRSVGRFAASGYKVYCSVGVEGMASMGTDMFFESVPDSYIDIDLSKWKYTPGDGTVPIVLPKSYLALYNFGFARSQSLPQISESLAGDMKLNIRMRGNGTELRLTGKVAGFSTRINTILVPMSFMEWSNGILASDVRQSPNRLILEVSNPADDSIARYVEDNNLELEDNKLAEGKTAYFLKVVTTVVAAIGLLISVLALYILMLSIFLLLQKNKDKVRNLILIGYTPLAVSLPYQMLTLAVNVSVFLMASLLLWQVRRTYMEALWNMFPNMEDGSVCRALVTGTAILLAVGAANAIAIYTHVKKIWKN